MRIRRRPGNGSDGTRETPQGSSLTGSRMPVLNLGYPDLFIEHGDPGKLNAQMGLDAAGIERSIRERFPTSAAGAARAAAAA